MTPDELLMNRRKIEKETATAEIAMVINRLMEERREPDHWEWVCLVRALEEVFSGCYGLAITNARFALTPPEERSPLAKLPVDPFLDRCDLQLLSRVLRQAVAEPVQEFPHFGPIVVSGRGSS